MGLEDGAKENSRAGANMKVELLGHEAEIEWISARQDQSLMSRDTIDHIFVFIKLNEPVCSVTGFGVKIPPRDYSVNEFVRVVVVEGEKALQHIKAEYEKRRVENEKRNKQREKLKWLVGKLGEKLGVPSTFD